MINVVLVDDHTILRAGLRRIIEESSDIRVVAEAADSIEAVRKVKKFDPDVAVIDITLPGRDGFELIAELHIQLPALPVLVLSMHEEQIFISRALQAGAKGYVTKKSAPDQLVKAIRSVHAGLPYLVEQATHVLINNFGKLGAGSGVDLLSARELQVLCQLALGKTNQEIADVYNISVRTVSTYRSRILKKLNLRNNADLTRFAISNHLIAF